MKCNFTLDLANEAATLGFASKLAEVIVPNLTIYLHGDLGAGKTTLTRGVLQALGYEGRVKSPTYTLVESYDIQSKVFSNFTLYHFDLYRFNDDEEWDNAGFRDYFNAQSVCIIEWPEKAQQVLPAADLDVYLTMQGSGRSLRIVANSVLGTQCLETFLTHISKSRA